MNDHVFETRPFCCGPACSLCSNQLGDKGTVALAEALIVNHTLRTLQLVFNATSIQFHSATCCPGVVLLTLRGRI